MKSTSVKLLKCVRQGELEKAAQLLTCGVDPNCADKRGYSALHFACQVGNKSIVKLLIRYGANPEAVDCEGFTPLEVAINRKHPEIVDVLLSAQVNLNKTRNGFSYLHACAAAGDSESLAKLFDRKEIVKHVNMRDKNGLDRTPLHWAAQIGEVQCCKLLLANGADLRLFDEAGFSPLHVAAGEGHVRVLSVFLSQGIDVDFRCPAWDDGTCLHNASAWGNEDVVSFLLANGANPFLKDTQGTIPVDFARDNDHENVTSMLSSAMRRLKHK
jgi:ankyrin repeat protein